MSATLIPSLMRFCTYPIAISIYASDITSQICDPKWMR